MSRLIEHERITAFIDGELELFEQLEMERRYETEPLLRRQIDDLRGLRDAVRRATCHAAPDALRERLAARSMRAQPGAVKSRLPATSARERWFDWRPMTASLGVAALAMILVGTTWTQAGRDQRIEDDVVASHVRATLGQHLVDVASSDHHQVKPFLSARLGFSPPVSELQIPGSEFLGGRVDYLDGRPVAALVYKQGPHVVDSFIWPVPASDSLPAFSQERGFRTAHWIRGGMAHWVISDVNAEEFWSVVQAVQRADAQP